MIVTDSSERSFCAADTLRNGLVARFPSDQAFAANEKRPAAFLALV